MNGYLTDDTFGRTAQLAASAYPVFDVALVGLAAWLVVRGRPAPACLWLVVSACASIVVGNAVFNVAAISFSFEPGGVADLGWMAFMVLLGAAALHPSVAVTQAPVDVPIARRTRRGGYAVLFAVAAVPAAQLRWGDTEDVATSVLTVALAMVLVAARTAMSGRQGATAGTEWESPAPGPFDHVPVVDPIGPRPEPTSLVGDAVDAVDVNH